MRMGILLCFNSIVPFRMELDLPAEAFECDYGRSSIILDSHGISILTMEDTVLLIILAVRKEKPQD